MRRRYPPLTQGQQRLVAVMRMGHAIYRPYGTYLAQEGYHRAPLERSVEILLEAGLIEEDFERNLELAARFRHGFAPVYYRLTPLGRTMPL